MIIERREERNPFRKHKFISARMSDRIKEADIMLFAPSVFNGNLIDDLVDDFTDGWFTAPEMTNRMRGMMRTDIRENDNNYELGVELPGFNKSDINLSLNDGYLTIAAKRDENRNEKDNNGKLIRRERFTGSAERSFYVGDDITEEDITARYENGILSLTIPKKQVRTTIPEKKTIAIE